MDITLSFATADTAGTTITLPASKSISNRVLIINALADSVIPVHNLSDCDDTAVMLKILNSDTSCFDVGHAGTAMRFLTAYLARIVGIWEITGSARMKERPIAVLVDALNRLGARIEYKEKEGFPPLIIQGSYLQGGEMEIPASVSSQYISALMMVAPYMEKGLVLQLKGQVVSRAYITMTAAIMRQFGADVQLRENTIIIPPCSYTPHPFAVEADWSSASYFYELLAVAGKGEFRLPGLTADSLQGDAQQTRLWDKLGVETFFGTEAVRLKARETAAPALEHDFTDMPDLVQSFTVACCLKKIPFQFTGLRTLRIKETDRIAALTTELEKLGYHLQAEGDNNLRWDGACGEVKQREINTYQDHRMAMAFAPAAWHMPGLIIRDKEVVAKSFPGYWEQLEKAGAIIVSL
ncbi:3-phosphoshikimate 1-carboxyvinyltransferase [Odoribacter lunatus]|uniref:3-phosphoshikimate 1-carboxyvinyltransferase n=1 Tax=Odoribacter lunatus TaxID=2941335 RepID=UPI0020422D26|nr:3-phosphoshikimate 1-carboxyvinyltransferase [Odoribacter lunatus]